MKMSEFIVKFGDFLRFDVGSPYIIEYADKDARQKGSQALISYAKKEGAKIRTESITGLDAAFNPRFMLRIELVEQGRARQRDVVAGRMESTVP